MHLLTVKTKDNQIVDSTMVDYGDLSTKECRQRAENFVHNVQGLTRKNHKVSLKKLKPKRFEVMKNGTVQGEVIAHTLEEAENIVFDTYGEHRTVVEGE